MDNKLCSIQTNVEQLNSMFNIANEYFYNKQLSMPVMNLTVLQKKVVRSRYVPSVWNGINQQQMAEIIIDSSLTDTGDALSVFKELLFCLVLHYCNENNIRCCTRGMSYFNKNFCEVAKTHGLICKPDKKYGYRVVGISNEAKSLLKTYGWAFVIRRERSTYGKYGKQFRGRSIKYVCPQCKTSVRATKSVKVLCIPCNTEMKEEVANG